MFLKSILVHDKEKPLHILLKTILCCGSYHVSVGPDESRYISSQDWPPVGYPGGVHVERFAEVKDVSPLEAVSRHHPGHVYLLTHPRHHQVTTTSPPHHHQVTSPKKERI